MAPLVGPWETEQPRTRHCRTSFACGTALHQLSSAATGATTVTSNRQQLSMPEKQTKRQLGCTGSKPCLQATKHLPFQQLIKGFIMQRQILKHPSKVLQYNAQRLRRLYLCVHVRMHAYTYICTADQLSRTNTVRKLSANCQGLSPSQSTA